MPTAVQYHVTANINSSHYEVGDTVTLCYNMTPANEPFRVNVYIISPFTAFVREWTDNGIGGGDCVVLGSVTHDHVGTLTFQVTFEILSTGGRATLNLSATVFE